MVNQIKRIMKELSIEDKAKRYDEAIERARVWKEKSGMPADRQGILDDIFPELKVSEDEEVRKALYEYFKNRKDDGDIDETWYGFSYDKILAWLEKQGWQKPIISDDALREGIVHFGITQYQISNWLKKYVDVEKQGEQILDNSVQTCKDEKTIVIIPKFRIGDEIKTSNEESLIITKIDEKGYWSEDLFICDFDEECLWDLVEQNPDWSEEDERAIGIIKVALEHPYDMEGKWDRKFALDWIKEHKKQLTKPQNTWKPSKEQIESIRLARTFVTDDFDEHPTLSEILVELEKQLKKLREE